MSKRDFERLVQEVQRLRISNTELQERVRVLEENSGQRPRQKGEYRIGDRIRIHRPTCPGQHRSVIPSDGTATVTGFQGLYVLFRTDSNIYTKRYNKNITLITPVETIRARESQNELH